MTNYLNGFTPDIECTDCDGNGFTMKRLPRVGGGLHEVNCETCGGHGWRPMTQDEIEDAAADAFSDMCEGEPPISADERHRAAWQQKQELNR
jgi:DnaJ-class molecular chaperone